MPFKLYAAGALAPEVASLEQLLALRRGTRASDSVELVLPSPQALPPNERRRASLVVRLTLACAEQALRASPFAASELRLVFASDEGTGEVCQAMLHSLASTREVSPLTFHNSVHNAPTGYFSIAHQNRQAALSISLGRDSFASGLLCAASEAKTSGQAVLFMAYDAPMPQPMSELLPVAQPSATAWVIACDAGPANVRTNAETTPGATPQATAQAPIANFELSLIRNDTNRRAALSTAWLPEAWRNNASAQGFVALALLADETPADCHLPMGRQTLHLRRLAPSGSPPPC